MDLYTLLVLGHIIGTILGVGGATIAEVQITQALRDGKVDASEKQLMHANYTIIRIGTAFILFSGIALVWWQLSMGNTWVLTSSKIWVKEIITLAIVLNAVALSRRWVPLWLGAAISFTSWWMATVLGAWHNIPPYSIFSLLSVYVFLIAVVAVVLHYGRSWYLKK